MDPRAPSRLTDRQIDVDALVRALATVEDGAICVFTGHARRHSHGKEVVSLRYEAYRPLAETMIGTILDEAAREFGGARALALHRLGDCPLGEASVAVVAASPHRAEAFAACRYVIDEIKRRAPIWKQELYVDGSAWVGDPQGGCGCEHAHDATVARPVNE